MLDAICAFWFELLVGCVFVLGIVFRFAFVFLLFFIVIVIYYGQLHNALYDRNVRDISTLRGQLLFSNFDKGLEDRSNTVLRLNYRNRYW